MTSPPEWKIRSASIRDVAAVVSMSEKCGLSSWSSRDLTSEIDREDSIFFVVVDASERLAGFIIGRIVARIEDHEDVAEIYNVGVDPAFREIGLGTSLLNAYMKSARVKGVVRLDLEVRSRNQTAIEFYRNNNFEIVGFRKAFYANPPDDATLMTARI